MKRLKWSGMPGFYAATREPRYPSPQAETLGATSGFIKKFGVLTKYDVLSAGHMVPSDNPLGALEMVRELTGLKSY